MSNATNPTTHTFRFFRYRGQPSESPWLAACDHTTSRGTETLYILPLVPQDVWTPMGTARAHYEYEEVGVALVPTEVWAATEARWTEYLAAQAETAQTKSNSSAAPQVTFQIEMTEEQVGILIDALDMYSRMGMGQLDVAVEEWIRTHFYRRYYETDHGHGTRGDAVREHVNAIKALVFGHPPNGSWGIRSEKVPETCREAYDIQQVIRKTRAEHRIEVLRAEGKEDMARFVAHTVDMNDYWATNPNLPPVKVTRLPRPNGY